MPLQDADGNQVHVTATVQGDSVKVDVVSPTHERVMELREDSHIAAQAERAHEVMKVALGVRSAPPLQEVIHDIAYSVAILEANPERKLTWGLVLVTQGPMDGWTVYVPSADVYRMHLDSFFKSAQEA